MVDPNRKINLHASDDSSSDDDDFNEDEIKLIKEFEEKFKDRFTENDEEFMELSKKKKKDPPILEWNFHQGHKRPYHNNRGGYRPYNHHRGGGHPYNHNRNYDNRKRSNDDRGYGGGGNNQDYHKKPRFDRDQRQN